MKLYKKRFCFKDIPQTDIVIFSKINSHYITEYILEGLQYYIFNLNTKKIYFNIKIAYYFLVSIRLLNFKELNKSEQKLQEILKQLRYIYFLSCLKIINPKVVITFIDNSQELHWLSRKLKSATFLAIQNGNRPKFQLDNKQKQFHKHFFSFGNNDLDRYKRFGHTIECFYPVGSLKASIYKMKNENLNLEYDISVISQYEEELFQKTKLEDRLKWNSMEKMHKFLNRYIEEHNVKAALLLIRNNHNAEDEIKYFDKLYNNNIQYIKNDRKKMVSYSSVEKSDVIVDFYSTLSIEAFGWGKKILLCDFTNSDDYNDYNSIIMFREPYYEAFKVRLNELRNESYDEYQRRTKKYSAYIMNNDLKNPPFKTIRKIIDNHLKKKSRRSI